MNTVKKGDKFEDKVYDLFGGIIGRGDFIAPEHQCKIYRKKGYYSRDREKNIIFDVSIEIFLPGHKEFSILFLVECKNYNHPVPVDDVEEFFAKVQQISGANTKAVLISTASFAEGTFRYSKSKGIGLARYFEPESLDWVLSRSPSSQFSKFHTKSEWRNAYNGMHSSQFRSTCFDFYGCVDGQYTNSAYTFLCRLALFEQGTAYKKLFPFLDTNNRPEVSTVGALRISSTSHSIFRWRSIAL
ncbi:MAG: restriction endonuclease [Verrucomicrobiales bacterium]|nr:restriction endonuclease [Verrucomicrobiales bacterium]